MVRTGRKQTPQSILIRRDSWQSGYMATAFVKWPHPATSLLVQQDGKPSPQNQGWMPSLIASFTIAEFIRRILIGLLVIKNSLTGSKSSGNSQFAKCTPNLLTGVFLCHTVKVQTTQTPWKASSNFKDIGLHSTSNSKRVALISPVCTTWFKVQGLPITYQQILVLICPIGKVHTKPPNGGFFMYD